MLSFLCRTDVEPGLPAVLFLTCRSVHAVIEGPCSCVEFIVHLVHVTLLIYRVILLLVMLLYLLGNLACLSDHFCNYGMHDDVVIKAPFCPFLIPIFFRPYLPIMYEKYMQIPGHS